MQKYKFLEHTADIKFQAFGKTLEESFENSALAMFNSMHSGKIKSKIKRKISTKGKDNEALLYDFLEKLLILFDSEGFFLSEIKKIKISKGKIEAEVFGDKAENYEIHIDIKAVTYNEMFVKKEKDKYICQVVLDV
jgi:SHS2 domain-containing protein